MLQKIEASKLSFADDEFGGEGDGEGEGEEAVPENKVSVANFKANFLCPRLATQSM